MPLSPEQEWTLAACGLVAHADGIVEAGEWDRVLWMLDERIGAEDASAWVERLADRARLGAHLDSLPPPMPFFAEGILEKAWRMALADGAGSEQEAKVHDALAARMGVSAEEAARLRQGWLCQAYRRSEVVAGFAALLANLDGRLDQAEAAELAALVERLPVPPARRSALRALQDDPPTVPWVVGELVRMEAEERGIALLALVPLLRAHGEGSRERALFLEVAAQVAIGPAEAQRMLARAGANVP
jgi:tellurite resistance protein